jgi:hypothetical protein
MLFDLRGRRRRAVQVTYLMLAVLMGGGLVLFGVGSDVSGGLLDVFKGGSGGGSDNSQLEKRIDRAKEQLAASPNSEQTLADLVRLNYQLAVSQTPSGSTQIAEDGKDDLRKAGVYWDRYVGVVEDEPDADLARVALLVFDEGGLNQPDKAKEAARVIAADANDTQTYLLLVRYAAAAKDKRTASLAAQKAVDLAPENQRKQVARQAKQLQAAAPSGQ